MSKKILKFLDGAKSEGVIDDKSYGELVKYNESKSKKALLTSNLYYLIYIIGGVLLTLGVILVISNNWQAIGKWTKLGAFGLLLSGTSGAALKIKRPRLSRALYFLQCGLVLAGIGLVAQIYHLHSSSGIAFLAWFLLTVPIGIATKDRWVILLNMFAFYLWLLTFLSYLGLLSGKQFLIEWSMILMNIFVVLEFFKEEDFWLLRRINYFDIFFCICFFIVIDPFYMSVEGGIGKLGMLAMGINTAGLIALAARQKFNFRGYEVQKYIAAFILLVINGLFYVSLGAFQVMLNIFWIGFSLWIIYTGVKKVSARYVNGGIYLLVFYIITKFIRYFSSMLKSGMTFIILGLVVIASVYFFEKMRKRVSKLLLGSKK